MNIKKIINLTPHNVVIVTETREITIPISGTVARVEQTLIPLKTVRGIPLMQAQWGAVTDLPAEQDGVLYIVSALVANAAKEQGRNDCVCPAQFVRNEQGQIIGAKALMFA